MIAVRIAGTGYYLPERRIDNQSLEDQLGLAPGWIERATGVRQRHRAESETSVDMAVHAGRMAIAEAGLAPEDIDLVIGASAGPAQMIPCTASLVQRAFLPEGRSGCFDVNATCLSSLVALQLASQLIGGGAYRAALIFSSEIAHPTLDPQQPESAVLMGDAAAAVVLRPRRDDEESCFWGAHLLTFGSGAHLTTCLGGGTLHHPNDPSTTPRMNLFNMNGPAAYKMAARCLGPFLDRFLGGIDWKASDVDAVVPHQASQRAVGLLVSRCNFRPEQLVVNLATRGNCVAASMPLAFAEAVEQGRIRRGNRILWVGAGAGMSIGAAAITF